MWPYAALTQTSDRPTVLREVARQIEQRQEQIPLETISRITGLSIAQIQALR